MRQTPNPMSFLGHPTANLDEVKQYVPAAFATSPHEDRSERYSFVSTVELLNALEKFGWVPHSAKQNGRSPYARHMIRLNNPDLGYMDLKNDKVKPQFILDNSHNGGSPAMGHMGLFRLVCSNGLVVAMPGMFTTIKLRHVGIDMKELKQLMEVVAEQYNTLGTHIGDMQRYTLNETEKEAFAIAAIAKREPHVFINKDGTVDVKKVTAITNPIEILKPMRGEDKKNDLWSIFNIVQEKLVKGEFERRTLAGRKSSPKGISNATRNLNFNKDLWTLAEEAMAPELT